jgi:tRNA A-37 threonylcarbamoyl transferase component Bud32
MGEDADKDLERTVPLADTLAEPLARADLVETVPRDPSPLARAREDAESDAGAVAIGSVTSDPGLQAPERRYRMEALLGEGGMGEVRLCADAAIGRRVAMKVMRSEYAKEKSLRTRFLREARVQGQLEHPAIVPVYDMGRDAAGTEFFTMKRVRGETLDQIVEKLAAGDPTARRDYGLHKLLSAYSQVCLAVHFAHERGVVHRDLKPANVMLGGFGEVYVLDWGLAKLDGESEAPQAERIALDADSSGKATMFGVMLGTPGYAAPEQIQGETVDRRADIWSLGAVLFELLALVPLNPLDNAAAMLKRTVHGLLDPRPSVRVPHRAVPPELEAICVRAMARDPRDRYPDARALQLDVERYLSGDRDEALRRQLAVTHLDAAKARDDDEGLAELGRAIALDPTSDEAVGLLLEQLTTPPAETPEEVKRELDALKEADVDRIMPAGALVYALPPVVVFLPLAMLMGTRSMPLVLACLSPYLLTGLLGYAAHRMGKFPQAINAIIALGAVAVGCASVLMGPFVFVPALATLNAATFCFADRRVNRTYVIAVSCLSVLVPFALELAGVSPAVHTFDPDGTMRIRSFGLLLPRGPTTVFLVISSLFTVAAGGAFLAYFARALERAELRRLTQTWQIQKLLPARARRPTARPSALVDAGSGAPTR